MLVAGASQDWDDTQEAMSWQSASSLLRSAEDLRETRSRCSRLPSEWLARMSPQSHWLRRVCCLQWAAGLQPPGSKACGFFPRSCWKSIRIS